MTTAKVSITAGSGTEVATYSISEDALTKQIQRTSINKSDGTEIDWTAGTAGTPAGGVASIQGVSGMVAVDVNLKAGTATAGAFSIAPRATASGFTSSRVNAAASTNATSLKASTGNVGEIDVFNVAAYSVFLKFYNKASAPTVGTDTPVWTIPIPAGTGFSKSFVAGKSFATGIAYAITKLQADSDTTAVAAGDLTGAIDWI